VTWREFKERLEAADVKDEDEIGYIDVSAARIEMSPEGEPFQVVVSTLREGRREIEVC